MRNLPVYIIIIPLILLHGCSGKGAVVDSITGPATTSAGSLAQTPYDEGIRGATHDGRLIIGCYSLTIDPDTMQVRAIPDREAMAHYDVTGYVTPPACKDCLSIIVVDFQPANHYIKAEATLKNPTGLTAYDVRGILQPASEDVVLVNADGYVDMYPYILTLNPFKAYAVDQPNRVFIPGAIHKRDYEITYGKFSEISNPHFVIDASWPGNCKEPYEIHDLELVDPENPLYMYKHSFAWFRVQVDDWQKNVNYVTLAAPHITGEDFSQFSQYGDYWQLLIKNKKGVGAGGHRVQIFAGSSDSSIILYQYLTLTITHPCYPDTHPPCTSIVSDDASPKDGEIWHKKTAAFGFAGYDPNECTTQAELKIHVALTGPDGYYASDTLSGENPLWTPPEMPNGAYELTAAAEDNASNIDPSPAKRLFTVYVDPCTGDEKPPEFIDVTPPPSIVTEGEQVKISWTVKDNCYDNSHIVVKVFEKTMGEVHSQPGNGAYTSPSLAPGDYYYHLEAFDASYNKTYTPSPPDGSWHVHVIGVGKYLLISGSGKGTDFVNACGWGDDCVTTSEVPALEDLQKYQMVILADSTSFDGDPKPAGDILKQYVNTGGGLIVLEFEKLQQILSAPLNQPYFEPWLGFKRLDTSGSNTICCAFSQSAGFTGYGICPACEPMGTSLPCWDVVGSVYHVIGTHGGNFHVSAEDPAAITSAEVMLAYNQGVKPEAAAVINEYGSGRVVYFAFIPNPADTEVIEFGRKAGEWVRYEHNTKCGEMDGCQKDDGDSLESPVFIAPGETKNGIVCAAKDIVDFYYYTLPTTAQGDWNLWNMSDTTLYVTLYLGSIKNWGPEAWDPGEYAPIPTEGKGPGKFTVKVEAGSGDHNLAYQITNNMSEAPPQNKPPVAIAKNLSPLQDNPPLMVSFSAQDSYDPDGFITAYDWDWGDDTPHGNKMNASHQYDSPGIYTVTLTVWDNGTPILTAYDNHLVVEAYDLPKWTMLMYMHDDDNLTYWSGNKINQMEMSGSLEGKLNILALWDHSDLAVNDEILYIKHDPAGMNNTIVSTHIDDGNAVIPPGGKVDMGDPTTVENYLNWAIDNYPAENFGFIIFDHGNGPFTASLEEDLPLYCCNGLDVWEIRNGFRAALDKHHWVGQFQLIGFDACSMGWLETSYCLKDVARSVIGSEMIAYTNLWRYDTVFTYLRNNIDTCTYEDICTQFVQACLATALKSGLVDTTLSAARSSDVTAHVIPALNSFAQELIDALGNYKADIDACRVNCGDWGGYVIYQGQQWEVFSCSIPWIKDIGYFAELVAASPTLPASLCNSAQALLDAVNNAMIDHCNAGGCCLHEKGWQIWFPDDYSSIDNIKKRSSYSSLGFSSTLWDDFLDAWED